MVSGTSVLKQGVCGPFGPEAQRAPGLLVVLALSLRNSLKLPGRSGSLVPVWVVIKIMVPCWVP